MRERDWPSLEGAIYSISTLLREIELPGFHPELLKNLEAHISWIGIEGILPEKCAAIRRLARKFYLWRSTRRSSMQHVSALHWQMIANAKSIELHIQMLKDDQDRLSNQKIV